MQVLDSLWEEENQVDNMKNFESKDFFQRLQEATIQKKLYIVYNYSNDLNEICKILQQTHLIGGYTKNHRKNPTFVKISLEYDIKGDSVLQKITPVSSIKQRIIINNEKIKRFKHDYPYVVALIRTRRGILSINDCETYRIGGEFLAYIK
jgi:ribosomal protein S8